MVLGSGLAHLDGYPFEVRYSDGALVRARVVADLAADAYVYSSRLFAQFEPDIALIVADEKDWHSRQPYGLPFFDDDEGQIRPGIVVVPAGSGTFWKTIARDIRDASPRGYARLRATYPDGEGGVDLQPFFDLVTVHELGHAFEVLGDLRLRALWLGEIFANLTLHAYVSTRRPEALDTLDVLPTVGAQSRRLRASMQAEGYSSLDDLEAHYTGGEHPMGVLNYVWYQYRWLRLAAKVIDAEGEDGLVRFWSCFRKRDRLSPGEATAASLASLLTAEVSETLGRAIRHWR